MNKYFLLVLIIFLLLLVSNSVLAICDPVNPDPFVGSGIVSDPFLISDCCQLQAIDNSVSSNYKLVSDIDCSDSINWNGGLGFIQISSSANRFSGVLDGNNKFVEGLFLNNTDVVDKALISYTTSNAVIRDLVLLNPDFHYRRNVAILVSENNGLINNVNIINGSSIGLEYTVGGLVSTNLGIINNSFYSGIVSGAAIIGGLAAKNYGVVENSLVDSVVSGTSEVGLAFGRMGASGINTISKNVHSTGISNSSNMYNGGLVGLLRDDATIVNSSVSDSYIYSTNRHVGGFVGFITGYGIYIDDCFVKNVNITSTSNTLGGFVGLVSGVATINNSFVEDANIFGEDSLGGFSGEVSNGLIINSYVKKIFLNSNNLLEAAIGGFTGKTSTDGKIKNCKVSETNIVSSSTILGGFVGYADSGEFSNCYTSDTVVINGGSVVGGFLGFSDDVIIENCFSATKILSCSENCNSFAFEASSIVNSSLFFDKDLSNYVDFFSTGLKTVFMKSLNTYRDAGWDIDYSEESVWSIERNNYPCLMWEDNCNYHPDTLAGNSLTIKTTIPEEDNKLKFFFLIITAVVLWLVFNADKQTIKKRYN